MTMETNNRNHTISPSSLSASSTQHGLLLIVIPDFEAPLGDTCSSINQALGLVDRLTIVVSVLDPNSPTPTFNNNATNGSAKKRGSGASFHSVQKVLSALYVSFTKQAVALGRPLAELDIVIRESCGYDVGAGGVGDEIPFDVFLGLPPAIKELEELNERRLQNGAKKLAIRTLDEAKAHATGETHTSLVEAIDSTLPHTKVQEGQYGDVALGGTFDHLHAGHKILLSMTAWISSHRVVCGVTDDAMLKTKKFKEFMEPLDKRIHDVERFLRIFKRGLVYEVVPISDMYGPTITDDKLEALTVSKETLKGGGMVNQERANRNLPPLTIEVINVISPTQTQVDEISLKISSTFIRQYLSEQASRNNSNKSVEPPKPTATSEAAH
ncbi:hypothetical protein BG015_000562 [Linnemannia schmuckeri]|uniref:Cytidyltransferase-like domain-containing protein n=1 Tax=Linnemannia schmuckeri TaxID=64567 RepID=A0A9P5S4T9_9FUNG|nr:hypothetical protein BG015_000562 [Linnemannia schmuckeri]